VSYNGSGVFNINTAGQPVVTGTVISSTAFNALTSDLGTGLSTAITKDGQTTATARIPFAAGINSSLVTDATSTTTGSIITAGGAGIAKSLYVGLAANIAGGVDKLTSATGVVSVSAATAPSVGQVLMATSGTVATWQTPAVTAPAGSNTQVQFNNSGAFGASSGLVFDGTSLGVGGTPVNSRKLLVSTASQTDISINAGSSAYGQLLFGYTGADNKGIVAYNNSDNSMQFYTNATERMRLNSTGALVLAGGTTSANGIGIAFPATQSASTDANTLDDYEEGTWTPNQGGGLTVVGTFSSVGSYTKIGRMVYVSGGVKSTSTVAFSAGGVVCSNLPFTAITSPQQPGSGAMSNSTSGPSSLAYSSSVYATASGSGADGYFFNIAYQI
jgi:hypothetical protein